MSLTRHELPAISHLPGIGCRMAILALLALPGCADDEGDTGTDGDDMDGQQATGTAGTPTTGAGGTAGSLGGTAGGTGATATGATATATGGGETGDAEACPGPDAHEENDDLTTASVLTPIMGKVTTLAGVSDGDDDYFTFTADMLEPFAVSGYYSVAAGATTDLSMYVRGAGGNELGRDANTRTSTEETMMVQLRPSAVGAQYFVQVRSNDALACTPYELTLDTRACYDAHEDNDDATMAAPVTLVDGAATVPGPLFITESDQDWYSVTVPGTDPVTVTMNYAVDMGDTTDLSVYIRRADGSEVTRNADPRTMLEETAVAWFRPTAPNSLFFVDVRSNEGTCQPYSLAIDTLACTDIFEDNDDPTTASPLTLGLLSSPRIIDGDEDHYQLQGAPQAGYCEISYIAGSGSTQDLDIYLYDDAGEIARNADDRVDADETARVNWTANDRIPNRARVIASADECTSYTIICQ